MIKNHRMKVVDIDELKLTVRENILYKNQILSVLDEGICREVIHGDCYKLRSLQLSDHPTILDIGGHVGSFASFARSRFPNAQVYSFEPAPSNYQVLYLNSVRYGFYCFNSAVSGSATGFMELSLNIHSGDINTGGYVLIGNNNRQKMEVQKVLCISLTDVLRNIGRVDLLKLDAEGAEFSSLYSLDPTDFSKIDRIRMEIHPHGTLLSGISFDVWLQRVLQFMKVSEDSPTPLDKIDGSLQIAYFERR